MSGTPRRSLGLRALPWRTGLLVLGLILVISQGGEDPIAAAERPGLAAEPKAYDPGSLRSALGGAVQERDPIAVEAGQSPAGSPLPSSQGIQGQGHGAAPSVVPVHESSPASFTPATTR